MKKNIKILVGKLSHDQEGKLSGGFAALKGGFQSFSHSLTPTNDNCSNTTNCNPNTNTSCIPNWLCAS